jgi:opacity protein-like surface antigen
MDTMAANGFQAMRHIAFLAVLTALAVRVAPAQEREAGSRGGVTADDSAFVSTARPQDLSTEIWLRLRHGSVIVADGDAVTPDGTTLRIDGTLRRMSVPMADVRAMSEMPGRHGTRNGLLGGGFLAAMFLLSPANTPGYYLGTVRTSQYGNAPEVQFPGLSALGVLAAAGAAATVAWLSGTSEDGPRTTLLDGTEDAEAWRFLLEGTRRRWHLRGVAAFVASNVRDRWHAEHARYGMTAIDRPTVTYYSSSTTVDPTDVNLGRLLSVGYDVLPRLEAGLALQADGVQRFYESVSFIRPGTPPQPVTQEVANEARTTSLFATARYAVVPAVVGGIGVHAGAGVGLSLIRVLANNYVVSSGDATILDVRRPAFLVFAGAEYLVDRQLSIGLHVDFSTCGSPTIPRQSIIDYDGRSYLDIDGFPLDMGSFGVGVEVGMGL